MNKQRKRLAAVLISATLVLSSLASIIPQGTVLAAEDGVQQEQIQEEGYWEPIPEEAPAPEPVQEETPVVEPAAEELSAAPAMEPAQEAPEEAAAASEVVQTPVDAAPADPSAAPAADMQAAAAEGMPAEDAELTDTEVQAPALSDEVPGEAAAQNGLVTVIYAAGEGGSVSAGSETVNLSEGGQAAGAQAAAYDGYVFANWTAADGTVVSASDYFAPVLTPDMAGEVTYTAHFEKKAVEAPATRMVTAEYTAGKGGSVSRTSETVDALAEGAAFVGSTAEAADGYAFVNWTDADGSEIGTDATFVPSVRPDTAERTVYTANFKKINTMPAQDFEGSVSGVSVRVHADEGRFPEGTTMHLAPVSRSSILSNDSVQDAVGEDKEVVDAIAVDITFINKNGEEIEPAGAISVSMSTTRSVSGESHQVLHIDDSGNASQVAGASSNGASFEAGEFSIYVIAGADNPAIATYIFHGADGNVISTQKVKDGETVYAPDTPEKAGSKFLGWSYTNGATSVVKDDPGDFSKFTATVKKTEDVNLYPAFQEAYYVFFLDKQGRVSTTKEGVSGTTIEVSDVTIPLDSTHSVTGWYTESELTNKVESVTLSYHNVTLYPKVEEGHYVYFVSGEGASYVKPVFIAAGKKTAAPEAPTRPGYTFKYWSEKENGSEYEFGSIITEDTTLHAVWEANKNTKYTVIYWWENANDNNYSYHESSEMSGVTGNTVNISSITKSYRGFTLDSDKTSKANNGVTISGDGSTMINVYYSRNEYSIQYFESEEHWSLLGSYYSWTEMTNLRITAKYGANIADRWPTSTSKIWGTKKGNDGQGAQPYQSGISTMPLDGDEFYYVSQSGRYTMNLHYYVEGIDGEYHLHHTDSFKTNNYDWSTTAEDHYDIEGFTYTKNVKDGTKFKKASENVYAVSFKYSRNSYSINFVNGDSKTSKTYKYESDISKEDLITAPERPSGVPSEYMFVGWFDNELGAGDPVKNLSGKMPAHNITLYAKWAAPAYTGTVHLNIEGTGTPMQITIDYGGHINENDMPTVKDAGGKVIREGNRTYTVNVPANHTWAGWATKSGDDFIIYNFNEKIFGDITLYPYYINGEKYTVTYQVGDGTGTAPEDSKKYAENSYADIQLAAQVTPPKGKTFLYWSDGKNKYYPGDKVKITGDLELTAVYGDTSPETSITYYSNYPKGSNLQDTTEIIDGKVNNTAITLDKAGFTAPDGYYFSHWEDAAGTKYNVGEKIGIDNTSANDLYAVWEQKKVITLTAKSGTFTYDGTEHTASGVEADTFPIDGTTYTISGFTTDSPVETDAGTYSNNISGTCVVKNGDIDVTDRFTVKTVNGSLTIRKRTVNLKSESASKPYDGTALTKPEVTVTGDGFIDGEVTDLKATGTITESGSVTNTITYTENSGFKVGNYEIKKFEGTLTITVNTAAIKVTADSDSKIYDGRELTKNTYNITGLPEGFTAEVMVSGSITDAGSVTNEVKSVVIKKDGKDVTDQFTNIEKVSGTLTVNRRTVNLKSESASKAFDGTALIAPNVTVTGDGFVAGEVSDITATGSITKVGSVKNTIEYTANSRFKAINYEITKDEGTLTITQNEGEIVVNAKNDEKKYDGNPLTKNEADVTGLPKDYTAEVTVSGSITNAGTADNVVGTVVIKDAYGNDVTNQFKTITKNNGTLTVKKRNVTLTSESVSREYDGTALTAPEVTVGGDGFVDGEVSDIKATGTITEVGNVPNSIAYTKGRGFKADNYDITKKEGTLTITQNTAEITVTADSDSKTYDGKPLTKDTSSVTGLPDGFTAVVTVSGSITDVGTIANEVTSVTISKDDKDVTKQFSGITKVKGKLEVSKRKVILTSESASKAYDGTALTRPDVTIGGNGFVTGEVSDVKAIGSITKAGSVPNTIAYTENSRYKADNYDITKNEGTLTITKSDKEIVVNAKNATKPYDGAALTESGSEVSGLPEGYSADVTVSGSITDVGTADNVVTSVVIKKGDEDVTDQFETITKNNGKLTVTKRSVTLTSKSAEKQYDGTALTAPEVTVGGDGFVDGEVSDIKAIGTITEVGNVSNSITYTEGRGFKADNYDITKKEGTLTITQNTAAIKVTAGSDSKTYDGTALTKNTYSITGLPSVFISEVIVSGSITDVGTAENRVASVVIKKGDEDVTDQFSNIEKASGTLTVNKRTVTLKSESASKVYDGKILTAPEVTITDGGFVKGEVSDIKATGSITKVGSVTNTITYTENDSFKEGNYSITKDEGTLTITQNEGEIVVNAKNASKTYDGTALTESTADVTGIPEGYTAEVIVSGNITDAGTADNVVESVVIKDASGDDVTDQFKTITKNNGTLTVTKRSVTLTSKSAEKNYDGTALTAPEVTVGGDGFVDGEVSNIKATGTITEVGNVPNSITYTEVRGFKADNYDITKTEGKLTITQNTAEITVTADSGSKTYDGTPLTKDTYSVTGLPEGFMAEATVSGSITNAGTTENKVESVIIKKGDADVTEQFANIKKKSGTLTINKRKVTFTSANATKEYDGKPLTAKNVTVSGDGFAEGEYAEYDVTGSQTEVGQSENTFTYKVLKSASQPAKASVVQKLLDFLLPKMDVSAATSDDPADNYDITVVYGTLEVTAKSEPEQKPDQKPEGGGGGSATGERAVAIYKVDEQTGAYLAGAQFALYDSTGKLIGTYETNEQGFLKASYLGNGSYYFVETKAPDGYAISQNRINFYLDQSHSYSNDYPWNIKVTNRRIQAAAVVQTPQAPAVTPAPAAALTNSKVPATGDESRMQFYGWLALFAAAAMSGWFVVDRKRRGRK